uniref:Uncharacterized protein n=1 Tax=Romanomermis culicivorax TaxID=13658 RepID=A0A915KG45_ROMCU
MLNHNHILTPKNCTIKLIVLMLGPRGTKSSHCHSLTFINRKTQELKSEQIKVYQNWDSWSQLACRKKFFDDKIQIIPEREQERVLHMSKYYLLPKKIMKIPVNTTKIKAKTFATVKIS